MQTVLDERVMLLEQLMGQDGVGLQGAVEANSNARELAEHLLGVVTAARTPAKAEQRAAATTRVLQPDWTSQIPALHELAIKRVVDWTEAVWAFDTLGLLHAWTHGKVCFSLTYNEGCTALGVGAGFVAWLGGWPWEDGLVRVRVLQHLDRDQSLAECATLSTPELLVAFLIARFCQLRVQKCQRRARQLC